MRRHRQTDQKATPHIIACNNRLSVAAGSRLHEFQSTFLIGCQLAPVALSRIGGKVIMAAFQWRTQRLFAIFAKGWSAVTFHGNSIRQCFFNEAF